MFEQTFVEGTQKTKKPLAVAASLSLQILALCVLILVPLIYTQALPSAELKSMLTAPAPPTAPVANPVKTKTTPAPAPRHFSATIIAPTVIPKRINTNVQEIAAPDVSVPGGSRDTGMQADGVISSILNSAPETPAPAPPKPAPPPKPLRVATGVAEANLIRKVMPIYPALAKSARIQGTVEFTAVISKEGTIEHLQLVRGHPLLVQAAKEAVLQWRYRPTLLNGQPVEVVTDIIVNFTLTQ